MTAPHTPEPADAAPAPHRSEPPGDAPVPLRVPAEPAVILARPEPIGAERALTSAGAGPVATLAAAGTALVPPDPDHRLSEDAAALVARGLAGNTREAYERHWKAFERWCYLCGRTAMPATAETLAQYVHHLTGTTTQYGGPPSPSTINHVLGCVQGVHKHAGQVCDVRLARLALRAYRRDTARTRFDADAGARRDDTPAGRGRRRSETIDVPVLRALVYALLTAVGDGELQPLRGQRDHLALVLAFAMAARASEIADLDIADLAFSDRGMTITVRSSKTDQDARGEQVRVNRRKNLEFCPVRLAQAWIDTLAANGITGGPLLRGIDQYGRLAGTPGYAGRTRAAGDPARLTNDALNTLLRAAVRLARSTVPGRDLKDPGCYSWHGLRAGFATSAAEGGAAPTAIATGGRWKGLLMVLHYWRHGTGWNDLALDRTDL